MPNQLQSREYWETADREQVEQYASGLHTNDTFVIGLARAELVRRDREYAEEQEETRRKFERDMFNAGVNREVQRRSFEKALADGQMAHASKLAQEQLSAASSAAKAAKWAAWATAAAALGAIAQAVIAGLK